MKKQSTLNHYRYNEIHPTHVQSVLVPYLHDRIIKPIITKSKYLSYHQPYSFTSLRPTSLNNTTLLSPTIPLIYISDNKNEIDNELQEIINTVSIESVEGLDLIELKSHTQFPLLLKQLNLINVPKKVRTTLERYVSKSSLRTINPDLNIAIELCLVFLSHLSITNFYYNNLDIEDTKKREGWKSLSSKILEQNFGIGKYKRIIEVLLQPTSKGQILECDNKKILGSKNYYYRLGEAYIGKGIEEYHLKEEFVKSLLLRSYYRMTAKAQGNIISRNLLYIYPLLSLPTIEEIHKEARRLIKSKYITNKKKRLCYLNKHTKEYFKDSKELSFVEESIELFQYLTSNGFMIPIIGKQKNGFRVVDSFTLMPSWIRALVKINGVPIVNVDYKCLHPNIAMNLYNGNKKFITHELISEATGIDKLTVKKEHLSFFNKHPEQMKKSPLYDYYMATEGQLMRTLINEKYNSKDSYKITSRRMFEVEVNLMTTIIEKLNTEGIHVLYIYDALACHPKDAKRVKQVMDEVILKNDIYTTAKIMGQKTSEIKNDNNIMVDTVTNIPNTELQLQPIVTETKDRIEQHIRMLVRFGIPKAFLRSVWEDVKAGNIINRQQIEDLMKEKGLHAA